jgi:hypothetical protein
MKEFVVTLMYADVVKRKTVTAKSEFSALNKAYKRPGWHWEEWDGVQKSAMCRAEIMGNKYFMQDNG